MTLRGDAMLRTLLLTGVVLGVLALPAAAQTEWEEVADEYAQEQQPDNPAWEEYAFDLEYVDGVGELSFVDIARQEQPFVVFFWLTDCPLCHLQLPYVQQLHNVVSDNELGVRVVSINVDHDPRECRRYIEEKEPTFELLIDPRARATNEAYHVGDLGCPLTYVFDERGELVDYLTGFRSRLPTSVLEMLDIELPPELRAD